MKFSLYFLFLLFYISLSAQKITFPILESQSFFGGAQADYPKKLILATDTTLIMGGYMISPDSANGSDICLVKIDTTGNIIWQKNMEMQGCQELRGMTPTEDGGVIFVGVTNFIQGHEESGDANFQSDGWVGCLDKWGGLLWLKAFGGKQVDIANAVEVEGKDVFVVGTSFSNDRDVLINHGGSDIWGFRLAKEGSLRFLKTIGGSGNEWGQAITACKNGDYVIAGYTNSHELSSSFSSHRNGDALLIRIKKSGTTVWAKTFSTEFGGYFTDIAEDVEGNLIAVGSYFKTPDNADAWIVKLGNEGNKLQDLKIGTDNDEYFQCVEACQDTTYLVGGYSTFRGFENAYVKGKEDFTVFKLNNNCKTVWRKTFGGPDYERCVDICEYAPGKFWLLGEKDNYFTGKNGNGK